MAKVGREAADAHLELSGPAYSAGKDRTPRVYHSKRNGLTIKFTDVNNNKPRIVVSYGPETRTLQLEEFIDYRLDSRPRVSGESS